MVWYKRNEWIKYMPEKHNPHDYDDPATFAEVRPLHPCRTRPRSATQCVCSFAPPFPPTSSTQGCSPVVVTAPDCSRAKPWRH